MDSGEESLDALEEVFQRIQTVTGEDNLDLLVTRFIQGKSYQHNLRISDSSIHNDTLHCYSLTAIFITQVITGSVLQKHIICVCFVDL